MAALSSRPSSSAPKEMLSIPVKKTQPLDLYGPLRSYIAFKYSESQAQKVEGVLGTLNKSRSDIERHDLSLPTLRDCLIHYFKCLCMVESLFPILPDPVIVVWYDAFNPQLKASQHNIHLEKAAVLFNLGAVCSQIGLSCDCNTIDGHRLAVDAFHDASDWFFKLWRNESEKASVGGSATEDVSEKCAEMLQKLMLAQAMELKFWEDITKGSSPYLCANASSSVLLLYGRAYDLLRVAPLNEHFGSFDNSWIFHVYSKTNFFHAETCYRQPLIPPEVRKIEQENIMQVSGQGPQEIGKFLKETYHVAQDGVMEQLLIGFCRAQAQVLASYLTPYLDLLSEVSPFRIKDGNLVVEPLLVTAADKAPLVSPIPAVSPPPPGIVEVGGAKVGIPLEEMNQPEITTVAPP